MHEDTMKTENYLRHFYSHTSGCNNGVNLPLYVDWRWTGTGYKLMQIDSQLFAHIN